MAECVTFYICDIDIDIDIDIDVVKDCWKINQAFWNPSLLFIPYHSSITLLPLLSGIPGQQLLGRPQLPARVNEDIPSLYKI